MQNRIVEFYNKNLDTLDNEWKAFCFSKFKGKEVGDKYYSSLAFWRFVEDQFERNERVRKGKS